MRPPRLDRAMNLLVDVWLSAPGQLIGGVLVWLVAVVIVCVTFRLLASF